MNHLIIQTHPNPMSFGTALCKSIKTFSESKGNTVTYRNLYETGFNPILSAADFTEFGGGNIPNDIKAEQELISNADHITFVFPVWWGTMPAMLKGYFDRVFSFGFAYMVDQNGIKGLLAGKKASFVCTAGSANEMYEKMGMHTALKTMIEDVTFKFCALEPAAYIFYGNVVNETQQTRENWLANIKEKFDKIL